MKAKNHTQKFNDYKIGYDLVKDLPWTPSLLQLLVFPTKISSTKGLYTTYLKWT